MAHQAAREQERHIRERKGWFRSPYAQRAGRRIRTISSSDCKEHLDHPPNVGAAVRWTSHILFRSGDSRKLPSNLNTWVRTGKLRSSYFDTSRLRRGLAAAAFVPLAALGATSTGTQTLNVGIGAIGKLAVVPSSISLTHTGSIFAGFTGIVTVQYEVRTQLSTGSASLTLKAANNFSPSTGPSVTNGDLTYTCSGATLGVGCSGTQTASVSSQTGVVTLGSGLCTGTGCPGSSPNSITVNLNLADSPLFKTGSYSTSLTFTISAL
jgi:hypothetical protein